MSRREIVDVGGSVAQVVVEEWWSSGMAVGVIRWAVGRAAAAVVVTYFVSSCCVHLGVGHGAGASAMYGGGTRQRVVSRVCVLRV